MKRCFPGRTAAAALFLLAATTATAVSWAQDWPTRPIRIVVPFAAGGSVDVSARVLAQALSPRLGQSVIVENRGGAGGLVGADYVAKAKPDGYTAVMASAGIVSIGPFIHANMPFDPFEDLMPVSPVSQSANVLVVPAGNPAKSVADFIEQAKAQPYKLNFGSSGVGSSDHMAAELFMSMAGVKLTAIPYRGGGPAMVDLVAGQTDVMFSAAAPAVAHIRDGKLRALGVTSSQRLDVLPDVPTIAEAGVPGYESVAWYGLMYPKGTPAEIVQRLSAATQEALKDPGVRQRLVAAGMVAYGSSPEDFAAYIRRDAAKWAKVVEENGIKAE